MYSFARRKKLCLFFSVGWRYVSRNFKSDSLIVFFSILFANLVIPLIFGLTVSGTEFL